MRDATSLRHPAYAQRQFFGERGVVDGAVGYDSLVSMTLNVAAVPLPEGVTRR